MERVEACPVTTFRYVAEERVQPYEVQTCNYAREERVEPYQVQTCNYVREERVEPYEVRTCEMLAEERVEPYQGTLRKKQEEELRNQAGCLNLVTNAVVNWNTVYMAAVIDQLRAEGRTVNEEDTARLSPARYEHINPYGKYRFEVEEGLSRFRLRPLRQPSEQQSP